MIFIGAFKVVSIDMHQLKLMNRKKFKSDSKPWITPEIVKLSIYRKPCLVLRCYLTTKMLEDFTIYLYIGLIMDWKKSKKFYYKTNFEECKNDFKKNMDGDQINLNLFVNV